MTTRTILMSFVLAAASAVAGCGGDAGPQEISGTASAGQPILGKVYVKDSAGGAAGPVVISPAGRFSISVERLKPPYVLKAEGSVNGNRVTLYSAGTAAGTVNINPMTDLVLHVAAWTASVDSLWSSPESHADVISATQTGTATDSVRKLLLPFLAAHGAATADPFSELIQLGGGLDAVFDRIAVSRDTATGAITITSRVTGATLASTTPAQIDGSALALGGQPGPGAAPPVVLSWYGPSGMALGTGYDTISQNVNGVCVSFVDPKTQGVGSVRTTFKIEVLDQASSVASQLGVSASAKMRMGLYSGSAMATYASESVKDSTSVFVAVYSEVIGYSYDLQQPKLLDGSGGTENWKDKFTNDVASFRFSCGDQFLTRITTGGKFVGILKIATSSDKEKTSATANLKAKSALFNSGSVSLKTTMDSLMQEYQASVSIFEMGPPETATPTDYESFMSAVQAFPNKVNACISDWQKCAYIVTFTDYATIAAGTTGSGTKTAAITSLIDYDSQYEQLLARITDMQARPNLYEESSVDLDALKSSITASKKLIKQAADNCAINSNTCVLPADDKLLDPFDDEKLKLPVRKLLKTQSCADYKTNYPTIVADGEYRMYFADDAELEKPFYLYCRGMSTSTPKEYLTLKRTSPPSTSPSYNFASSVGRGDAYTVFSKVGVLVNPSELAIVRNDFQYSTTTWVSKGSDDGHDDETPYGQAKTSYEHSDWSDSHQGHANLDLTGTGFAISATTDWVVTGNDYEFTAWHTTGDCGTRPNCKTPIVISADRKSVHLYIAGKPGWNNPKADIRLTWSQ